MLILYLPILEVETLSSFLWKQFIIKKYCSIRTYSIWL